MSYLKPGSMSSPKKMSYLKPGSMSSPKKMSYLKPGSMSSPKKMPYLKPGSMSSPKKMPYQKPGSISSPKKMPYRKFGGISSPLFSKISLALKTFFEQTHITFPISMYSDKRLKQNFYTSLWVCFFLSFLLTHKPSVAQNTYKADDICGEWWTPNNDGRMVFFRSGSQYYARVSWLKNPNDKYGKPRCEKQNPIASQPPRPLQDLILFADFIYDAAKEKYTSGKIYDPEDSGNKYSGWLRLIEHNVLEIHGFVGFSLIGKSVYFTRVQK